MVEISGAEGTGKTEILLHLLALIILPKSYQDVDMQGAEAKAIFIDLDYKFSIVRLALILEKKILEKCKDKTLSVEDVEALIKQCLSRCLILRCSSSQQFIVTLESLQKTVSEDPNIVAIFIDTISAFYWIDKCAYGENASVLTSNSKLITEALSKLVNGYNLWLVATKALYFKKKSKVKSDNQGENLFADKDSDARKSYTEFLPKSWENFVQQRFQVEEVSRRDGAILFALQSCTQNLQLSLNFETNESGVKFI